MCVRALFKWQFHFLRIGVVMVNLVLFSPRIYLLLDAYFTGYIPRSNSSVPEDWGVGEAGSVVRARRGQYQILFALVGGEWRWS